MVRDDEDVDELLERYADQLGALNTSIATMAAMVDEARDERDAARAALRNLRRVASEASAVLAADGRAVEALDAALRAADALLGWEG